MPLVCKGSRKMQIRRGGVKGWENLRSLMELKKEDFFRVVSPHRKTVKLVYWALSDPFLKDDIPMIDVKRCYQYTGWAGFRKPSNNRPWGSRKKIKDKRDCHHFSGENN